MKKKWKRQATKHVSAGDRTTSISASQGYLMRVTLDEEQAGFSAPVLMWTTLTPEFHYTTLLMDLACPAYLTVYITRLYHSNRSHWCLLIQ